MISFPRFRLGRHPIQRYGIFTLALALKPIDSYNEAKETIVLHCLMQTAFSYWMIK